MVVNGTAILQAIIATFSNRRRGGVCHGFSMSRCSVCNRELIPLQRQQGLRKDACRERILGNQSKQVGWLLKDAQPPAWGSDSSTKGGEMAESRIFRFLKMENKKAKPTHHLWMPQHCFKLCNYIHEKLLTVFLSSLMTLITTPHPHTPTGHAHEHVPTYARTHTHLFLGQFSKRSVSAATM